MTYVKDLLEGMRISQVFLCKQKQSSVSKTGKNYYSLRLQDKTGTVDAKIWSLNNAIEHFEVNDFVMVEGDVRIFNSAPQISINRIRRAKEGEYDETLEPEVETDEYEEDYEEDDFEDDGDEEEPEDKEEN